jgi:hypothetical protein
MCSLSRSRTRDVLIVDIVDIGDVGRQCTNVSLIPEATDASDSTS